jgi:hypothetical protein
MLRAYFYDGTWQDILGKLLWKKAGFFNFISQVKEVLTAYEV